MCRKRRWRRRVRGGGGNGSLSPLLPASAFCNPGYGTFRVLNLPRQGDFHAPYLKNFLKKLLTQVELDQGCVLDPLYELCAHYMASVKMSESAKEFHFFFPMVNHDAAGDVFPLIFISVSFILPFVGKRVRLGCCSNLRSCPQSRVLAFSLHCSLNMLEGGTGCSIWPASLFLSELILSHPELFSNKSCFEIGSGVGLVGLCLAHVKAYKVILSDGDLATLSNMRFNLELNHLNVEADLLQRNEDPNMVKCLYLPWESASESQLQDIMPDVVLGADLIYDPVCQPHLVRVLSIVLNSGFCRQHESCKGLSPNVKHDNGEDNDKDAIDISDCTNIPSKEAPVAYIAYVIRNIETLNYFLSLGEQANLDIVDLTDSLKPLNLLCYMQSYNQANVRLLRITASNPK
ncbi:hypothetical protein VNO78_18399 [Psophocarpus tetragonolobus]|uniref:Uncharacterized protein n=1 Tax=Psophocarpus tetragonolobus TaxID=3891 RepID=A0AAN9SPW1_PSOTE